MWGPWAKAALLAYEAQQVMILRSVKLALGGRAAKREATRMVSEKAAAAAEIGVKFMIRPSMDVAVKAYRGKVRKNLRRLRRS